MAVPCHWSGTESGTIVVIQHETSRLHGPAVSQKDGALLCTQAQLLPGLVWMRTLLPTFFFSSKLHITYFFLKSNKMNKINFIYK